MNSISLFNVRISGSKDKSPINSKEITTGLYVQFKAGEKIKSFKENIPDRWRNYNLIAYGDVAQKIMKMKFKTGNYINVVGTLRDRMNEKNQLIWEIKITAIDYASFYIKPDSITEVDKKLEIEESAQKEMDNQMINLDDNDFFQNMKGNDDELVFC